jgi:hypothetical protein
MVKVSLDKLWRISADPYSQSSGTLESGWRADALLKRARTSRVYILISLCSVLWYWAAQYCISEMYWK